MWLCKTVNSNRGLALVVAVMVMAILLSMTGAGLLFSGLDLKTTGHHKTGTMAFYATEAGLSHGWRELGNNDGVNDFAAVFSAAGITTLFDNLGFGLGGSYTVTAQGIAGSNPNRIKVTSTGCIPVGCPSGSSKSVIEAEFKKEYGKPDKAILTNGDLKISGNPKIMGTGGGAHSNDDMQVTGNPSAQMVDGLTASNKPGGGGSLPEGMDISGVPCIGSPACSNSPGQQPEANILDTSEEKDAYEAAHSSMPEETIPRINPADYAPKVATLGGVEPAYILHDDGTVTSGGTCGTDGLCTGGTVVAIPAGWSFVEGKWKVAGSSAANGIFYSEVKVEISGSPGNSSSPWLSTIIARNDIKISGSPDIKPYPTTSSELKNHLFVTGNDLEISGYLEAGYAGGAGAILAHQQFKIIGNPNINGFIIAGDGQPTWDGDPFPPSVSSSGVTVNEISGNPTITYNADFDCLGPGCPPPAVLMVNWRQLF